MNKPFHTSVRLFKMHFALARLEKPFRVDIRHVSFCNTFHYKQIYNEIHAAKKFLDAVLFEQTPDAQQTYVIPNTSVCGDALKRLGLAKRRANDGIHIHADDVEKIADILYKRAKLAVWRFFEEGETYEEGGEEGVGAEGNASVRG